MNWKNLTFFRSQIEVILPLALIFCCGSSEGQWSQVPAFGPSGRAYPGMVFDSANGKHYLFGGVNTGYQNDMWELAVATSQWTNRTPGTRPSARSGMGMAYDSTRNRVVIFGGGNGTCATCLFNDMYYFSPVAGTWSVIPFSGGPGAREGMDIIINPTDGLLYLFGGRKFQVVSGSTVTIFFQDLWKFDFSNLTWTDITPATKPSKRYHHSWVYDSLHNRSVLFGGQVSLASRSNDLWTYSGSSWSELDPGGAAGPNRPTSRESQAMAYDSRYDRFYLHGGNDGLFLNDLWEYVPGSGWNLLDDGTYDFDKPDWRYGQAATYDAGQNVLVIFGGQGLANSFPNDTWKYNRPVPPTSTPTPTPTRTPTSTPTPTITPTPSQTPTPSTTPTPSLTPTQTPTTTPTPTPTKTPVPCIFGQSLTLQQGWNLIGFTFPPEGIATARNLAESFQGQGLNVNNIAQWTGVSWQIYVYPLPFANFAITSNKGYMVRSESVATADWNFQINLCQ